MMLTMREILFRGKRMDNGEWVTGYYVKAVYHWHKNGIHEDWMICGAAANGGWFAVHKRCAVDPATVGQFTGLTDKNGKKIFEGDIVEYKTPENLRAVGEVKFGEYGKCGHTNIGFFCKWNIQKWTVCLRQDIGYFAKNCKIEVIGNIHDNKELLED